MHNSMEVIFYDEYEEFKQGDSLQQRLYLYCNGSDGCYFGRYRRKNPYRTLLLCRIARLQGKEVRSGRRRQADLLNALNKGGAPPPYNYEVTYMSIGARLEAALRLLKTENNLLFADIGSDHAFLAIEVIKRSIAASAIAADINEMPLLKGRENAFVQGVDMQFFLSDGFKAIDALPITSAAVCGMGGELIARIVLESNVCKSALLVLQPMSAQEFLRKALWDNGFCIINEEFVIDAGKPYTVMQVKYSGKSTEYCYTDLYLGKQMPQTKEFAAYCEKILNSTLKRRQGITARGGDTGEVDRLIELCQTQTTSF